MPARELPQSAGTGTGQPRPGAGGISMGARMTGNGAIGRRLRAGALGAGLALGLALPVMAGDFADSDAGGPDQWRVVGVPAGDTLAVRAGPGRSHAAVGRAGEGERLANLGCRRTAAGRWCKVRTSSGVTGWAYGRYLRE